MVEQAFKVDKTSQLYRQYFAAEAERQRFHVLARVFFEKYSFEQEPGKTGYYICEDLRMQLSDADRAKYEKQLKKLVDKNELCYFKKNSKVNKDWHEQVVSLCNMDVIDGTWCWYFPYIGKGKYALWHKGTELYGYLLDEHKDALVLDSWMEPIKMSEYYAILESFEQTQESA